MGSSHVNEYGRGSETLNNQPLALPARFVSPAVIPGRNTPTASTASATHTDNDNSFLSSVATDRTQLPPFSPACSTRALSRNIVWRPDAF